MYPAADGRHDLSASFADIVSFCVAIGDGGLANWRPVVVVVGATASGEIPVRCSGDSPARPLWTNPGGDPWSNGGEASFLVAPRYSPDVYFLRRCHRVRPDAVRYVGAIGNSAGPGAPQLLHRIRAELFVMRHFPGPQKRSRFSRISRSACTCTDIVSPPTTIETLSIPQASYTSTTTY